jgi:hypothetical protein
MSKAFVIEIENLTAGVVAKDGRGYSFFSAERMFDSLDQQEFSSVRDAERALKALLRERRGRKPVLAAAL